MLYVYYKVLIPSTPVSFQLVRSPHSDSSDSGLPGLVEVVTFIVLGAAVVLGPAAERKSGRPFRVLGLGDIVVDITYIFLSLIGLSSFHLPSILLLDLLLRDLVSLLSFCFCKMEVSLAVETEPSIEDILTILTVSTRVWILYYL